MKQKLVELILKIYTFPLNVILSKVSINKQNVLKTKLVKTLYSSNCYNMISFWPKSIDDVKQERISNNSFEKVAVILQGPLTEKDEFTFETIKMYKKYYKNLKIIVSTWDNSKKEMIDKIEHLGVDVVKCRKPIVNGIGNINMQLVSSLEGVKKAKELGAEFVIKTRTDQRYYNPCAFALLKEMCENGRVAMLGGVDNSYFSRSFQISDFMLAGYIDDVQLFYNCKLDDEDSSVSKYTHKNQKKDAEGFLDFIAMVKKAECDSGVRVLPECDKIPIEYANPETLLTYNYCIRKNNYEEINSITELYQLFLRDGVVIIDADSLGFYWLKYDFEVQKQNYFDRGGRLDFAKWCDIRREYMEWHN